MHPSLETKAPCDDPERAREVLRHRGASLVEVVSQHDVYFATAGGRLKLRTTRPLGESATAPSAVLIAYDRPTDAGSRLSRYWVVPVGDQQACLTGLTAVLGRQAEVGKRREVWRVGRTTVHLDDVAGLGEFLELETSTADGAEAADEEHGELAAALGIRREDTVAGSYSDLVRSDREPPSSIRQP